MPRDAADPRIFVSYARSDGEAFARALREKLVGRGFSLWHDRQDMAGGRDWWRQITEAIDTVEYLVLVMTPAALASEVVRREWRYARQQGRCVVPVMGAKPLDFSSLPRWMASAHFYDLDIAEQERRFIRQLESPCTTPRVPMMAPQPPTDYVPREEEFAALKAALLDPKGEPVAITSALKGAGGYGKTTLAKALCADDAIQDAYHDGILWVTLGESPGEPQGRVEDLIHVLQGRRESFATREAALARLAEILADRRCLLVIDDVWHRGDVEPFLQAGPRCARLLTTRNAGTLPHDAVDIRVDQMKADQAVQLLQEGLPAIDAATSRQLATRLGEWPLLLKLVNGALRERVNKLRAPLADALIYVEKRLDKHGLGAFDPADARAREGAVAKTLGLSLDLLLAEDRERRERLNELAVFPEDVSIPVPTVELLWRQTAALDEIDTEDLLQRLFRLSLLLDLDLAERTVRLHDVVRTWLRREIGPVRVAELDRALVAGYRARCGGAWHTVPDDGYVLQHLPFHLHTADEAAWRALLLDPRWMARKLAALGTTVLIADYDTVDDPDLHLIGDALRLSAHVLARDPAQLAAQLCGRLGGSEQPAHIRLTMAARAGIERTSLLPRFASFAAPGGPLLRTLAGHDKAVTAVAVTPDGRHAVSASSDRTLKVWELASGAELRTLAGHGDWVKAVAVTPDGRHAVSASDDRTLKVWELASGAKLRTLAGHGSGVKAVAVTPDGRHAVSASRDRTLKVWELASGAKLRTLAGHGDEVNAVVVTPDGRHAVSASDDGTLKVWELASGAKLRTLAGHESVVKAVAVTPDGRHAVSASSDRTLKVWDLASGAELRTLAGHDSGVAAVAVTPDGRHVVSASYDRTLKVWELASGAELRTLAGHGDEVRAVAVTPDGRHAVSASRDRTLKVWDLTSGTAPRTLAGHGDWVTAVAVTPDGRHAVSASWDATLKVWELASGAELRTLAGHDIEVTAVAVTPDGRQAVSASRDRTLKVWDLASGAELRTLAGHGDWVTAVAVTPAGRHAVSASLDATLEVWDLASGAELRTFPNAERARAVAVTPDGRHAVSASYDRTLKVWDLASGAALLTLAGHGGDVMAVAVTPDGRHAVSASSDRTLKVWDLASGAELLTLAGHDSTATAVAVTPDGRHAVSASSDRTLKVWDLASGELIVGLTGDQSMTCIAAASDRVFVAGDSGGTVHVLELHEPQAIAG